MQSRIASAFRSNKASLYTKSNKISNNLIIIEYKNSQTEKRFANLVSCKVYLNLYSIISNTFSLFTFQQWP